MSAPQQVAYFRITAKLGEGEIRDANRNVAVKILPPSFAADADRITKINPLGRLVAVGEKWQIPVEKRVTGMYTSFNTVRYYWES